MLVYIDIKSRTKDELDRLIELGGYRDYSEAVSVAIANQLLLHREAAAKNTGTSAPTVQGDSASAVKTGSQERHNLEVPVLFSCPHTPSVAGRFADYQANSFVPEEPVSVDRWIFGQYNKLLPVKATCRALAKMMGKPSANLAVTKVASEIAS